MSLREEIDRLIRAEREKLEQRDRRDKEYHSRQQERFRPMRALLEEVAGSISPEYLRMRILEHGASFEVGTKKTDRDYYFEIDARWWIEPNYSFGSYAAGESVLQEEPGVKIEEKLYFHLPEYEVSERTQVFSTENDVAEYLVRELAKKIAHYEHLKTLRSRRLSHAAPGPPPSGA